jgi:hypothetical protein
MAAHWLMIGAKDCSQANDLLYFAAVMAQLPYCESREASFAPSPPGEGWGEGTIRGETTFIFQGGRLAPDRKATCPHRFTLKEHGVPATAGAPGVTPKPQSLRISEPAAASPRDRPGPAKHKAPSAPSTAGRFNQSNQEYADDTDFPFLSSQSSPSGPESKVNCGSSCRENEPP